ncbi:ferritin family protein [Proteinivorax hydrogeniformans]|uniref:Ferritin family protein n=1 Tax=Proteinivorax hydrogeniformans TaxID=1826727 RepID=A0AAU8HS79_9FIRM
MTEKLVIEKVLGEAKGTDLERDVKQNFKGETTEVGIYLAMAAQAQREGYPEIAEVLKTLAWEEAEHAGSFAQLNGMIKDNLFDNLKEMLEGEVFANQNKRKASEKARELGLESVADYFNESAKDEARHAKMLEGMLKRYSK